ncbi:hypothetical protein [Methylopila sp. M107]|nr:hypothetical protein [Methylopila sp. M107]
MAERARGPIRAACAYLALAVGVTGTLSVIPTLIAILAARGFQ